MAITPVPAPGWRPLINGVQTLPVNSAWSYLEYAGVVFGPFTTIEDYQPAVHYDQRNSRSYVEFTLTCTSTVTWSDPVGADQLCGAVRQALTTQGGQLVLRGRAVGEMLVNIGTVIDIRNGPIPTVQSYETKGELTSVFHWTLTWCLPDCGDAVYTAELGTLSNTNTVSTQMDNGYATRTVSGKVVIPQNRAALGARFPADAATKFLKIADGRPGSVFPPLPIGFRRAYTYSLNEDRSELSYSCTDKQIGREAPPPGCVTAEEGHENWTEQAGGFYAWNTTFTARYEVPWDGSIDAAIEAFFEFVNGRLFFIRDMLANQRDANGNPNREAGGGFIPRSFRAEQPDVRGRRTANFSMTCTYVTGLRNVLEEGGIWRPVANGNWQAWFGTMEAAVFNPLGTAVLDYEPDEDHIVNLCEPNTRNLGELAPGVGRLGLFRPGPEPTVNILSGSRGRLTSELLSPQPNLDWLYYLPSIVLETDDGVNGVRTLPLAPLNGSTDLVGEFNGMDPAAVAAAIGGALGSQLIGGQLFGPITPPVPGQGGGAGQPPGVPTDQTVGVLTNQQAGTTWVERRVRPQTFVWFSGAAARYGRKVPEPSLTSVTIGGIKYPVVRAMRAGDGPAFSQRAVQTFAWAGGKQYPLYRAGWRMRYGVIGPVTPGEVQPPPNPRTGVQ